MVTGALLVGGTIELLTVLVSYLSFRFPRLRPGDRCRGRQADRPEPPAHRITLEEVAAAAQQNRIASSDDVRRGVLEPNGRLSFIPKS